MLGVELSPLPTSSHLILMRTEVLGDYHNPHLTAEKTGPERETVLQTLPKWCGIDPGHLAPATTHRLLLSRSELDSCSLPTDWPWPHLVSLEDVSRLPASGCGQFSSEQVESWGPEAGRHRVTGRKSGGPKFVVPDA